MANCKIVRAYIHLPAPKAYAISLLAKVLALAKKVLKKKCAEQEAWMTKKNAESHLRGWTPAPLEFDEDEKACYSRSPHGCV